MEYSITNEYLSICISDIGAELKSIKKINDDVEYLWQMNKEIWERQAPLLFPVIGRLKDEEYEYDNKTYKMGIHGFAYVSLFKVFSIQKDKITFLLKENKDTLKVFPFKFELYITYLLKDNSIIKKHKIINKNNNKMYFEIGGHEGYNLALFSGEKMEDYYIEFENSNKITSYVLGENMMVNKEKKEIQLKNQKLYLFPEVFKDDALIIDEFKSHKIAIKNDKNNRSVTVNFDDFKYLGIWTKYMVSNYVCIEPWSSLPDANFLDKKLINKQDIIELEKNSEKVLKYTITIN